MTTTYEDDLKYDCDIDLDFLAKSAGLTRERLEQNARMLAQYLGLEY